MVKESSVSEKSPAFQFYAKDWLADGRVISMSLEERGAYIHLMAVYWNDGGLPDDSSALADVLGVSVRTFERIWKKVGRCFDSDGKRLTQKRLEKEKSKQASYKNTQSLKGQKSAKSRVSAKDDQPRLNPVATEKQPDTNSPFPFPFPSPDIPKIEIPSSERTDADDARNELRAALGDLRSRSAQFGTLADQAILDYPRFHSSGGGICRIDSCTNPGLLRATAAKVRAYGKPPKRPSNGAPAWDRGIDHGISDEDIAWDPRLGPRPEPIHQLPESTGNQDQHAPTERPS